jgi:hypothetical protein
MKKLLPLLLLSLVLCAGCTRRYMITLNNGNQISTHGKPKLRDGVYYFKDIKDQETSVPSFRVREIAPASGSASYQSSGYKHENFK